MSHCLACDIAADLRRHRDESATEWSIRRGTLNFAAVIAERACPEYTPATQSATTGPDGVPGRSDEEGGL